MTNSQIEKSIRALSKKVQCLQCAPGGGGDADLTELTERVEDLESSSANWNTAYTDRNKWNGGSSGLVAATGRTSLGLGTAALNNTGDFAAFNAAVFIGTTSINLNRASGAQSLTGITSIDGSASTLSTARNIQGISFDGSANIDIINGTGFVKSSGTTLSYVAPSTIGESVLVSTNPSAITFLRANADNSVTWRSASDYRTDIGVAESPVWVDYSGTSTVVGWSSFTTKNIRYSVNGNQVTVNYFIEGTSDATTITFTLPFSIGVNGVTPLQGITFGVNNGSAAVAQFALVGNTVTLSRFSAIGSTTSWANSGTKRAAGTFTYEKD